MRWAPDLPDGEMNFFSVAADGKINNWVVMQNELAVTTIITLFLVKEPVLGPDGIHLKMKGKQQEDACGLWCGLGFWVRTMSAKAWMSTFCP